MSTEYKFKAFYTELSSGIAWSLLCSFAAIVISIIALAKCAPSSQLHADYIGAIVGMLALLVTVLVGWQVYALIEIKAVLRRMRKAENELSKAENRLLKKIYKENANLSMMQAFSLIRGLENNLNENHILEVRLLYTSCAETLKKQLLANEVAYIHTCLQFMEMGVLFADRLNAWERLFDDTTAAMLNNTFDEIIPLSAPMTQEQKSRLLHIHDSRTSMRLHNTIQQKH